MVRRCIQSLDAAIAAQRLSVPWGHGRPLVIDADSVRIEQVMMNLTVNAVKYTPPGGRSKSSRPVEQDLAVVRFRDSGVGIAPDVLPRIFDLFVQAERTLDRARGGLGIGLTLARRLIELHAGTSR